MAAYFNGFLIVMALLALAVYIALHYFEAGYGYLFNRKYGFPIPNRICRRTRRSILASA